MKKIIFKIVIISSLLFSVNGFAMTSGSFFEQKTEETNTSGSSSGFDILGGNFLSPPEESSTILKVINPGTGGTDPNPSVPVAEGGMILFLISAAYGIVKRKKK